MTQIEKQYEEYLKDHIKYVKKGYKYLKDNLPELFKGLSVEECSRLDQQIKNHDKSKYSEAEFLPYANYFYGTKDKTVKKNFDLAWLHHQKENPHHWQYWILIQDEDTDKLLDIPYEYIIEMICDWWAFSWKSENLYEIFSWYNKQDLNISKNTRKTVESILKKLKDYLDDYEIK